MGAAAVGGRRHRSAALDRFPADAARHRRDCSTCWRQSEGPSARGPRTYARVTQLELDATEQLVAALYANMADVPLFKRLTLLYFAAAATARPLGGLDRPELAPGFLLHAHPTFGPELQACAAARAAGRRDRARDALLARIDRAIEPFDIAGLLDRTRRDWYPCSRRISWRRRQARSDRRRGPATARALRLRVDALVHGHPSPGTIQRARATTEPSIVNRVDNAPRRYQLNPLGASHDPLL